MTTCSRCWWFYVPGEPGPIVALIAHWEAVHGGVPAVRYANEFDTSQIRIVPDRPAKPPRLPTKKHEPRIVECECCGADMEEVGAFLIRGTRQRCNGCRMGCPPPHSLGEWRCNKPRRQLVSLDDHAIGRAAR